MVQSGASTVEAYLRELPDERRAVVITMRELVRRHLPAGYEESLMWGMITYGVPLERFPDTYNGQPLCYIGLAAQKNHFALYLMGAYEDGSVDRALRDGFARAGKKLDMGKSCLRFKRLDELPLDVIGQAVAAVPPETLMSLHDAQHGAKKAPAKRKPAAKKKTVKKTTAKKAAKTATTTKTARNSTTRR